MNFSRVLWVGLWLAAAVAWGGETNWPQFRGPRGDGVAEETGLAVKWDEATGKGIKWKTAIHGRAWSSPVIWGEEVWMTSATENGMELFVICVDRETGKIRRDQKLFDVEHPQAGHAFNSYASPTPVIEGDRLYASFGAHGNACVDTETGKVLWTRRDLLCDHYRGPGSSPIVHGDLLFLNFDGIDAQFVVALDKHTGKTVWRRDRSVDFQDIQPDGHPLAGGDFRKAFATCHVAALDGRLTLLSQGSKALYAYDPATGEELWRVEERNNYSGSTRPVVGLGMVFVPSGFSSGQLLALQPGAPGEVLDVNSPPAEEKARHLRLVWRAKKNVPKKPSLTLVDGLLFAIDDNGVASCWDARSGDQFWNERIGGNYSASPLAAGGRLYFFSEEGKVTVVAAGREFKRLAENQTGDGFMSSPAVSGRALFLRSRTSLYRIED